MKLDRNLGIGRGKYALIKLRNTTLGVVGPDNGLYAVPVDAVDFGGTSNTDFFVIRLKDKYAAAALGAYAMAAFRDDPEYASEVLNLAKISATHVAPRIPD